MQHVRVIAWGLLVQVYVLQSLGAHCSVWLHASCWLQRCQGMRELHNGGGLEGAVLGASTRWRFANPWRPRAGKRNTRIWRGVPETGGGTAGTPAADPAAAEIAPAGPTAAGSAAAAVGSRTAPAGAVSACPVKPEPGAGGPELETPL